MAQSRAEIVARWRAKRDPRNQWLFIVERHLGIPRKKKYQHIGVVEWRMKHKRGPKPRAPIPIDRATAVRCVMSERRLAYLSFCSSMRRG